jgi:HSP20 family protein
MVKETRKKQEIQKATPTSALTPWEELDRMREEMDRWMGSFFPGRMMRRWGWPSMAEMTKPLEDISPKVNVIDKDEYLLVRAEIPGVEKKDLDIDVTENMVSIRGSRKHEEEEEKGEYYRREISSGAFARSIPLPTEVDPDQVKANFKDGVLQIRLPKTTMTKRRRIEVES